MKLNAYLKIYLPGVVTVPVEKVPHRFGILLGLVVDEAVVFNGFPTKVYLVGSGIAVDAGLASDKPIEGAKILDIRGSTAPVNTVPSITLTIKSVWRNREMLFLPGPLKLLSAETEPL